MMGSGGGDLQKLGRELGLPEFTNPANNKPKEDWKSKLTKKGDAAGRRSILVKRIVDSGLERVVVEAVFMAKTTDTKWETIFQSKASALYADQTDNDIKALDGDARISSAIATLKSIGLADDALIQKALRKGAATQDALQTVSDEVDFILNRNVLNLDRPLNLQGMSR